MAGWLRPHKLQRYKCMTPQGRKRRSLKKWLKQGISIPLVAVFVSIAGYSGTWFGASSTYQATQIREATSLLSVEPRLQVEAAFSPFGNPPTPPRILLWNSGKVDAVAVTVQMNIWEGELHPDGVSSLASIQDPVPQWSLGDIAPYKTHVIPVSAPSTQPFPVLPEEYQKLRHRFIQLIIRYLRAADRKSYEQRSYYFVGTKGKWVSEKDPRSDTEFSRRIKKSLEHPKYLRDPSPLAFDKAHFTSK
jgi:hypothetical protein